MVTEHQPNPVHADDADPSSVLLADFKDFIKRDLRVFFWQAAAISDLECVPYGNIGTLAPVAAYLSICGMPLPQGFETWSCSCTAFAPFLRGHLRFYLDAQHVFVRALVDTLHGQLGAARLALGKGSKFSGRFLDRAQSLRESAAARGLRNVWLSEGTPGAERLYWHGYDVAGVTTLDEWMRISQGKVQRVYPGLPIKRIAFKAPEQMPFFALDVLPLEAGPHRGKILCRQCVRPAQAAVLAHYDLTPDHPLAQFLAGYSRLPDQVVDPLRVDVRDDVAGDWASLKADDPWRLLLIETLQTRVSSTFRLPL